MSNEEDKQNEQLQQIASRLVGRRGVLKGQLTRFKKFIDDPKNASKISEISTRIQRIEISFDEFNSVQTELEECDESELNSSERVTFEDDFYEYVAKAREMIEDHQRHQDQVRSNQQQFISQEVINSGSNSMSNNNFNIQLPPIILPEFEGSYEKWSNFLDSFSALVDKNMTLSNIQKFYYLQASLKGEAKNIIDSLEVSDSNYPVAWGLLKDRYENKKCIIKNHVKQLFDLPHVNKDSFLSLRSFLDTFQKNYRALKNLKEPVETWSTLLIHLLLTKLDLGTKKEWEIKTKKEVSPPIETFITFLSDRCQVLESVDNKTPVSNPHNQTNFNKKYFNKMQSNIAVQSPNTSSTNIVTCIFCKNDHNIYYCNNFKKLSVSNRLNTIRKLRACTNCLRLGHTSADCRGQPCRICKGRHNSLLHLGSNTQNIKKPDSESQRVVLTKNDGSATASTSSSAGEYESKQEQHGRDQDQVMVSCAQNSTSSSLTAFSDSFIILSTALVHILDKDGNLITCRAILDSASQSNYISQELFKRINVDPTKVSIKVIGINGHVSYVNSSVKARIKSLHSSYNIDLNFLVSDQITTDTPQINFDSSRLGVPNNINLADPSFHETGKVDMLLGAGIFYNLLLPGQILLGKNLPLLQNTKLGWIVAGGIGCSLINNNITRCIIASSCVDIENKIERFWLTEEVPSPKSNFTREENEVETHFKETYARDEQGNFVLRLPFRDNLVDLGQSYDIAVSRFQTIERKMNKNREFKDKYSHFMSEYINLGHMSEISSFNKSNCHYFLPHHAVIKQSSLTTRLRVVFDASCASSSGISLNNVLKIGPCIQDSLFSILLRFRLHSIVISADIAKMYRCVKIHENDRQFQRIVWRENPSDALKMFELNTLTYGTGPASFLATRCLKQLALDNQVQFPEAAQSISEDFYMDDYLISIDNVETGCLLIKNVSKILGSAGFLLRQWSSNNKEILDFISRLNLTTKCEYIIKDEQNCSKTLGTVWDSSNDIIKYSADIIQHTTFTKRLVLSVISQIFDILGLIGPIITKAKIFMQKLWSLKIGWDDPVPEDFLHPWLQFYKNIYLIQNIKIPRQVLINKYVHIEMHIFNDASQEAFGSCIYFKSIDSSNQLLVRLVCSKSRVAPLKVISLPRLELQAALLGVKLGSAVLESLRNKIKFDRVVYWSDSTIVLAWIATEPNKLKTFVANRISKIQSVSQVDQWRHVPTQLNPADYISRGIAPEDMQTLNLWFDGPDFLRNADHSWPKNPTNFNNIEVPDIKPNSNKTLIVKEHIKSSVKCSPFFKYSSLNKLIRIVAYLLRFKNNTLQKTDKRTVGKPTFSELDQAMIIIIRYFQQEHFYLEIKELTTYTQVSKKSKLARLSPFLDKNNLIRVGGRLKNADIPFSSKHPIVLPSKCHLTSLIIRHFHFKNLHAGPQTLLAIVRQTYWPVQGRNTVREILRKCVICFQVSPTGGNQKMGDLPAPRVQPSRPFAVCGVDGCGPYFIKNSFLRNTKSIKVWICIFICFSSKAIHIEVVSELSTNCFLNAFKRFIARRGLPSDMYSDNGTNFVGASNIISEVKAEVFQFFLMENRVNWHFIPPRAPHHGGLWESAVRLTKFHIKRILQNVLLTYESFYTLLVQIESIVNSRPLTPLTENPEDIEVLTPGHFLIGKPLLALPENPVEGRQALASNYKQLRCLFEQFWKGWSRNYLTTLQERTKWQVSNDSYKVGQCVLVHGETAPLTWKIGRILAVHPGSDGLVRVVTVKTKDSEFQRPITKISVLPIND